MNLKNNGYKHAYLSKDFTMKALNVDLQAELKKPLQKPWNYGIITFK